MQGYIKKEIISYQIIKSNIHSRSILKLNLWVLIYSFLFPLLEVMLELCWIDTHFPSKTLSGIISTTKMDI